MYGITHKLIAQSEPGEGLSWWLGLREIDPGDAQVVLGWGYQVPPWIWAIVCIAAGLFGWAGYRRQLGRRTARVALGVTRSLTLLVVAVLLAQPMLILPREHREPDHVLMLVDRSESLTVADLMATEPGGTRYSRDTQLRNVLEANSALWSTLSEDHRLDWIGFSDRVMPAASADDIGEADGGATALRSAIDESLRLAGGKPLSAIVLLSDGRSTEPIGTETFDRLARLDLPVFAVPLGSAEPMLDLSIERVDAPSRAFVKDVVPIQVTIGRTGTLGGEESLPAGTVLKLIDTTTGQTLDEQPVDSVGRPVRLLHTPRAAGGVTWRLQLESPEAELSTENNARVLDLSFDDRPIRALYIEGYPRWEYRYLSTLLKREDSIACSIMLISADRTFAQEGDLPLRRLPQNAEEMRPFDVVILGDVPPGYFTADQFRLIYEQVSIGGAGLMLLAGPEHMPTTYGTSPLSAVLPITPSANLSLLSAPITMEPTPLARALGVLHLMSAGPSEQDLSWPRNVLAPFQWAVSVDALKPASEVLAVEPVLSQPMIVRMRFGAGQSMLLATDEIWRWRRPWGELYVDRFWTQLIRLLARGRLDSDTDSRARLAVSHRRASAGDTLSLEVTVSDQALIDARMTSIDLEAAPASGEDERGPRVTRWRETITLTAAEQPGVYRGTWSPRVPGQIAIAVRSGALAELGLEQSVEVIDADAELRQPMADHDTLRRLAERTGGAVLSVDELDQLPLRVRNRARITSADISEPLTRSPLVFAVLLGLLTVEWIGRKLIGLA